MRTAPVNRRHGTRMGGTTEKLIRELDTPAIGPVLDIASRCLSETAGDSARLEAEILLAYTVERERTYLRAWPEAILNSEQIQAFARLTDRRIKGEPIAYITGRQEFWSLSFKVTPDTLIPRADTETLVEHALRLIPTDRLYRVADLGTGSGAIAAALATERRHCRIVATDNDEKTIAVARENFERLGLPNIICARGSWCDALLEEREFDLILSNPPYVPAADPHMEIGDLLWEPRQALTPGPDGLESIQTIVYQAPQYLVAGGRLLLEHGLDQGRRVRTLLEAAGFRTIETHLDLGGRERLTEGVFGRRPAQIA